MDVDGTVDITGNVQLHANLLLRDDDILKFGNSDDLQIEHDGTDSFITNLTGDLHIRGNGDDLYLRSADDVFIQTMNGETAAKFIGDGAVEIYYDNSKKFETTSNGVKITGGLQDKDGQLGSSGQVLSSTGLNLIGLMLVQDPKVLRDIKVPQVLLVLPDPLDPLDQQDLKVMMVPLVLLVLQDLQVLKVLMVVV